MKTKTIAFLIVSCILGITTGISQCAIPNGDFENFDTIDASGLTGPVTYELPQEWIENPLANIFTRFITGTGFFNKYAESDANGNALLLTRSKPGAFLNQNNGYIRFECNNVPEKLIGRVKFSGSSNRSIGQEDALTIGAFFSTVSDTLTVVEGLNLCLFPERTKYFTTETPIDTFIDFEIDLSHFIDTGVDYSYFTIMIKMKMLNNLSFDSEYATAVLDDLRFEYKGPLSIDDHILNEALIYPNPANNEITIESTTNLSTAKISIIDVSGRLVMNTNENITNITDTKIKINITSLTQGIYFLNIKSGTNTIVKRIVKK